MSESGSCLISVVGPTAVGKTEKSIEIAEYFNTEIVSADSRQFYQEMEVGTAKPTKDQLARVNHHFINSHSIEDDYSAGEFERDCLKVLEQQFLEHKHMVMVGGSGMYIKAICEGFDEMPEVGLMVREKLNAEFNSNGLEPLLSELKRTDPEFFQVVDKSNYQRVIRGLEVIRYTGKTFSSFRNKKPAVKRPFNTVTIGLDLPREELYNRINRRMDVMIGSGLFEEAENLYEKRNLNALQTVGYKEIFNHLDGQYDKEEAIRLLKRNSRRYAKRQLTWFKANPEIHWFDSKTPVKEILISLQLA